MLDTQVVQLSIDNQQTKLHVEIILCHALNPLWSNQDAPTLLEKSIIPPTDNSRVDDDFSYTEF